MLGAVKTPRTVRTTATVWVGVAALLVPAACSGAGLGCGARDDEEASPAAEAADEEGTEPAPTGPPGTLEAFPDEAVRVRLGEPADPRDRGPGAFETRIEVHAPARVARRAWLLPRSLGRRWQEAGRVEADELSAATLLAFDCGDASPGAPGDGAPEGPGGVGCTPELVPGAELVLPPVDGRGRQCGRRVSLPSADDPEGGDAARSKKGLTQEAPAAVLVASCDGSRFAVGLSPLPPLRAEELR